MAKNRVVSRSEGHMCGILNATLDGHNANTTGDFATAHEVATEIAKKVLERMTNRASAGKANLPWSVDRLEPHLIEVANWSSRVELFGLAKAKATDSDTVRLFTSLPRKFRSDHRHRGDGGTVRDCLVPDSAAPRCWPASPTRPVRRLSR